MEKAKDGKTAKPAKPVLTKEQKQAENVAKRSERASKRNSLFMRVVLLTFINRVMDAETPLRISEIVKSAFGCNPPGAVADVQWLQSAGFVKILKASKNDAGKADRQLVLPGSTDLSSPEFELVARKMDGGATAKTTAQ